MLSFRPFTLGAVFEYQIMAKTNLSTFYKAKTLLLTASGLLMNAEEHAKLPAL